MDSGTFWDVETQNSHEYTPIDVSKSKRMLSSIAEKIYAWDSSKRTYSTWRDANPLVRKICSWYLSNGIFKYDVGDVLEDKDTTDITIIGMAKKRDMDFYLISGSYHKIGTELIDKSLKNVVVHIYKQDLERGHKRINTATVEDKLGE